MATVSLPHKLYHYTPAMRGKYGLWKNRAINAVASALLYYSKCKYDICRNKEYI
jgi:hypothetical protein